MYINNKLSVLQIMYLKSAALITLSFIVVMTSSKLVHAEPTKWENARTSLTVLLDSGWQVVDHTFSRVKSNPSVGISGFDEFLFTFMLTNGRNKYILCLTNNPSPPISNNSSCRNLN